ncbi:MAG: phosphoribosyl-AMP cyclohydrolase [Elusimicrobiota bacterium]|jgi:phosphoribosyl-AMP cyclohydrolase|nr:phosphoribosyl-AMP cyclohydrolase [Elusimicrobiota bacterium]
MYETILTAMKFDDKGLIPAVVQDYKDNTVLMVAYMNKESVKRTLKTKKATFWSRSRQEFWVKGESSGNIQKVKELYYDCDADCILIKVNQIGGSACHTGHRSCFFTKVSFTGNTKVIGKPLFDPKKVYGSKAKK